ncbi:MAG: PKD domain-containing protein [Acidobacteriia bacterium]|nr:PKD domain-containing protein [Terriglobia bacterium]
MKEKMRVVPGTQTRHRAHWASFAVAFLLLAVLTWTGTIVAQGPISPTQFDITGFLQEATLGGPGTGPGVGAHSGGTLKVNGHSVIVPSETIVILPANALTWQELFAQAPAPYTGVATGMAMADIPTPLTTYEIQVVGNRVGDTYIAGLIYISQQGLNAGAGFINFIDYTLGEMRVGGIINDPNCAQGGTALSNPLCSGARVRINDPTGKFGRAMTPDQRFTLDPDNPTIKSGSGFPACFPRTDPAGAAPDALCPEGQRPKDLTGAYVGSFFTNAPVAAPGVTPLPDPNIQAPFEVGDYVMFAGTLVTDNAAAPTAGPWPANGAAGTYISAHTITSNIAIFTQPGTNPAYVETDVFILGTGGLTVLGAGEAVIRTRFEGMTTDTARGIHLYGIDVNAADGSTSDRDWGTIGVDQGPPTGAVMGRWRFRPPCAVFGTVPAKPDKQCVMNALGVFLPAPREMRAVIEGLQGQNPASPTAVTSANGLYYGQYHAPILEFIFPENIPGSPIVPNNFESIPFLACGGYTSSAGTLAAQLNPWPGAAAPSLSNCPGAILPPVANAGAAQTVPSGVLVTLNGSASTGTAPLTFSWVQAATDLNQVLLTGANTANPTFTAPIVGAPVALNFTLTVTNSAGSSSASVTVTVDAAAAPTASAPAPLTVISGTPVTMTATCTDPLGLACTFSWLQTSGAPVVLNPNPFSGATISFTVTLPVGTTTSTVLQFQVTATNSAGVSSAPASTSVTVNPAPDGVLITSAVYRISKQRLDLTASSSVISPNIILTLQPYVTTSGATFDPRSLGSTANVMTNNGGGLYVMTLVGAPEPAVPPATPLIVTSNIGGRGTSGLTLIRQ